MTVKFFILFLLGTSYGQFGNHDVVSHLSFGGNTKKERKTWDGQSRVQQHQHQQHEAQTNGKEMPCDEMNMKINKNMNSNYFTSDASIDLSFDDLMNELIADVLYLELLDEESRGQSRKGTVLLLNNPSQVSGNTYHFNIDSQSYQSRPVQYWQETQVFYLCKS